MITLFERYLDTVRALGGEVDGVEFPMPHDHAAEGRFATGCLN